MPANCYADDIQDYVTYQSERLRSYESALDYHRKTKQPVIIWVGIPESDEVFKVWKDTSNTAYHVFIKEHPALNPGITIGKQLNGVFVQYKHLKPSEITSQNIGDALTPKVYVPQEIPYFVPSRSCPNGNCPLRGY